MSDNLTDRKFWSDYWKSYHTRKVPSRLHYDNYMGRIKGGGDFIEIGGFPGEHSLRFFKMCKCNVTLLDFYIDKSIVNALEQVNNVPENTIRCIESDFFAYKEPDSYDVVFSDGFIEHFEDTANVIERHTDLLKSGGTLLFVIPNLRGLNGWVQKKFDPKNLSIHNLKSMRPEKLREILKSLPLTDCKVTYSGKPMVWLEHKPERTRILKILVKTLSYAIKLFPVRGRILSPYIVVYARKI